MAALVPGWGINNAPSNKGTLGKSPLLPPVRAASRDAGAEGKSRMDVAVYCGGLRNVTASPRRVPHNVPRNSFLRCAQRTVRKAGGAVCVTTAGCVVSVVTGLLPHSAASVENCPKRYTDSRRDYHVHHTTIPSYLSYTILFADASFLPEGAAAWRRADYDGITGRVSCRIPQKAVTCSKTGRNVTGSWRILENGIGLPNPHIHHHKGRFVDKDRKPMDELTLQDVRDIDQSSAAMWHLLSPEEVAALLAQEPAPPLVS